MMERGKLFMVRTISAATFLLLLLGNVAVSYSQTKPEDLSGLIQHAVVSSGKQAFTFDRTAFERDTRDLPIGVFDSGIGGLTVLEAILSLDQYSNETLQPGADGQADFEGERFIYFGDGANMPYGNYAAAGKEDYLRELILKDTIFLLGNRYWTQADVASPSFNKPPVKAIVIACNTATAYGLTDVKAALKHWNIPVFVVGVVEAGARGVLEMQPKSGESLGSIAVLATVGTCSSNAYPRMIQSALGSSGKRVPTIVQQGFVELAAAIEGDASVASQGSVADFLARDLRKLMEQYHASGAKQPIGTIVLGCTHYPLVQSEILDTLNSLRNTNIDGKKPYADLVADNVQVVNPAELTAKELFRDLARNRLRATTAGRAATASKNSNRLSSSTKDAFQEKTIPVSFYLSVANRKAAEAELTKEGALDQQYKYSRSPGNFNLEDTINVPMTEELLPASSIQLMKGRLPHVWQSFQANQG